MKQGAWGGGVEHAQIYANSGGFKDLGELFYDFFDRQEWTHETTIRAMCRELPALVRCTIAGFSSPPNQYAKALLMYVVRAKCLQE